MLAAGLGQLDAPAEADLAALRILADAAAGGDRQHLEPQQLPNTGVPALSTARASSICRVTAGSRHRRAARPGDGDAVVAFERLAIGQVRAGIAGKADVDDGAGQQFRQQLGVALARHRAAGRDVQGAVLRRIAFHHEQSGAGIGIIQRRHGRIPSIYMEIGANVEGRRWRIDLRRYN